MNKLIFVVGGARSGKSRFSVNLAKKITGKAMNALRAIAVTNGIETI